MDLSAKNVLFKSWYKKFCDYLKYLHEIILIADDIEVLIKLLPTFGYFCCVIMTTQSGEKLKETLRFWKVRILEQEDLLNLGLDTRLLVDSEEIIFSVLCFSFGQNESNNNNDCFMQILRCLH